LLRRLLPPGPGVALLLTARKCPWLSCLSFSARNALIHWLYSRSKLTCMLRSILRADGVHGHRPAYYSLLHHLLPAHTANTISRPTLAPSQPIPTVHRVPHSLINHKPHKIALMHRVKIRPAIYLRGSSDSLKSQSRRRMKPLASTLGNLGILHYASSSLSSEFRTVLAAHSTQVLSK